MALISLVASYDIHGRDGEVQLIGGVIGHLNAYSLRKHNHSDDSDRRSKEGSGETPEKPSRKHFSDRSDERSDRGSVAQWQWKAEKGKGKYEERSLKATIKKKVGSLTW
ncbi:hypothetical protein MSG28_015918 [Choristoneura fumiferana]|uniref:Uncharacterized protein n=1 Tax=Choristoneura fumiferana TaxID=7141 RepID=A0ACC0K4T9_CHOFU|nr:hypothetical protein MSG28_015918 [Choristoneura fumiferana]